MSIRTLDELNKQILVFDPVNGKDVPANEFLEENDVYNPFIIKSRGTFSGEAIGWPSSSVNKKIYVECYDDAPESWQGNAYGKWVKPNGRTFIKVGISGSKVVVVKPDWYIVDPEPGVVPKVPGTGYFNLVPAGSVKRFMVMDLAIQELPEGFNALGVDHCNQKLQNNQPISVYELQPITLDELNNLIRPEFGELYFTGPAQGGALRMRKSRSRSKRKNKKSKSLRKNRHHKLTKKGKKSRK